MATQFDELKALSTDEVVTHSFTQDIPLSGGKTLALITLDNGRDHTRPCRRPDTGRRSNVGPGPRWVGATVAILAGWQRAECRRPVRVAAPAVNGPAVKGSALP